MIQSIFKFIWKRKRHSRIMISEMLISFLLLFALLVMLVKNLDSYMQPTGFQYDDVWVLEIDYHNRVKSEDDKNRRIELFSLLKNEIMSLPSVENLTACSSNTPYDMSTYSSAIKYKNRHCGMPDRVDTDYNYASVLRLNMKDGRWFNQSDPDLKPFPIVINSILKDILFENEPALNKVIHSGQYRVVGIIENFKIKGEFSNHSPLYFTLLNTNKTSEALLVKTKQGADALFKDRLIKKASSVAKEWTINAKRLTDSREAQFKLTWIPILIFSAVVVFLVINILLGLIGLLWYSISKRKQEIGLRQSVGASVNNIVWQFIVEILALATFGILPGVIIAIQFPILKVFDIETKVYIMAILATTLTIYLLVTLCALLPSAQAAKIQPAVALHEE